MPHDSWRHRTPPTWDMGHVPYTRLREHGTWLISHDSWRRNTPWAWDMTHVQSYVTPRTCEITRVPWFVTTPHSTNMGHDSCPLYATPRTWDMAHVHYLWLHHTPLTWDMTHVHSYVTSRTWLHERWCSHLPHCLRSLVSAQEWTNRTLISHERTSGHFLVLPGSLLSFTEITEYTYISLV